MANGNNPYTITPTATGTYTYTITAFDAEKGCTTINTVTITVSSYPTITSVIANPATICAGGSSSLVAASSDAVPSFANIGTQTTTISGNDGNPYRSGNGTGNEIKTQLLIKASELAAAGLNAGNITSLGFTTTTIGGTVNNFTIKMGHTPATVLTTTFETPVLTTVFTQASFTTVLGLNTHTFTTPFNWDGTSNILIEICQVNAAQGTNTVAAYTPTYNSNTHKATTTTSCSSTTGVIVTTKPIMRIGGQVGTDITNTFTWVWNPGAVPGSTVTVSPATTTTYTATATNPVTGCFVNSLPVTVTVNQLPGAPVATNSTQCGSHVPTASVTSGGNGGNGTFNWYANPTGGTALQSSTSATYTTAVSSTRTFYVSEGGTNGCEGAHTPVTVTVTNPPSIDVTGTTSQVCLNGTVTLSATSTETNYNYTWTASPAAGSGIATTLSGSGTGTTSDIITPTVAGTYVYTVSGSENINGCTGSSSASVIINPKPLISSVTATPATICSGGNSTLEAKSNIGAPLSIKIGTGTTGFTGAANPYWNSNSADGSKFQFLYKASALQTLGLTAGPINGIVFKVITNPIPAAAFFNNFAISMGQTAATALTATWQPGMQLVKNPINHVPVTGDNTYNFDNAFVWDGVSNIVIQVCYDNDPNNTCTTCTGSTLAVEYTASQSYNSGAYYYETNSSNPNRDMCGSTAAATLQANLPNVTFIRGFTNNTSLYNWSWNPGSLPGAIGKRLTQLQIRHTR